MPLSSPDAARRPAGDVAWSPFVVLPWPPEAVETVTNARTTPSASAAIGACVRRRPIPEPPPDAARAEGLPLRADRSVAVSQLMLQSPWRLLARESYGWTSAGSRRETCGFRPVLPGKVRARIVREAVALSCLLL